MGRHAIPLQCCRIVTARCRLSGQARFQEDVGAKREGLGREFFRSGPAFFNATGWQVFQRCIVADAASFLAC
jgi:hypothetical protein